MIGYSRVVGKIGLKHSNEKAEFPFWIDVSRGSPERVTD